MADEVHVHQTPPADNGGRGGAGWVVALLVVIVLAVVLWFVFARGGNNVDEIDADIDVNIPAQTGG